MTNTLTPSQMPATTDISVETGGRKPIRFVMRWIGERIQQVDEIPLA